jgi:biotin-dependent carboxylase-like uncharacterized protein
MPSRITVLHPGALTTIQDLGRPGLAYLGIPRSGAADRPSLMLANRLVGNREDRPALETTVVGPRLKLEQATTLALTGAVVDATLDDRPLAMNTPIHAPAGSSLSVGSASAGLRTYLAVRGGIDGEPTFGSCSSDLHNAIGPAPLAAGDTLEIGTADDLFTSVDSAPAPALDEEPQLRVMLGPRDAMFTHGAIERLLAEPFMVTTEVSRVGARLEGPPLERADGSELLSEPVVTGSLQVPPSGQPILLLSDHPTTGGYPVIAVLYAAELAIAGQLRPGQQIRFRTPGSVWKPA